MSFNSKYTGAQVEAWLDNIKNYSANDILEKLKTVDGSNSGLDADLLDGKHLSDILASNVASATKLQTARTIWGQSFDGTGDVNGAATFHDVISINRNGSSGTILDTSKSALKVECYSTYTSFNTYTGGGAVKSNVFVLEDNGNVGIGTTNPTTKLDVNGTFNATSIKENGTDISSTYLKKNKNTLIIGGQQRVDITPYYDTSSGMKVALVTLIYGNYSCVFLVYSNGTTFHRVSVLENAASVLNLEISEGKLTAYNKATSSYTVPITIVYLS